MKKIDKLKRGIVIVFDLLFIIAGVAAILSKNWLVLLESVLGIVLMFLPSMIEKKIDVDWPSELEILILVFVVASIYFGELKDYYLKFWWWDIALHTLAGIIIAMIAFSLVYILNKNIKEIKLNPLFVVLFTFSFAISIGALWEILEFSIDQIFGMNMQKSGLVDTMWDLVVDAIGAAFISIIGYLYLKGKEFKIIKKINQNFAKNNPKLFNKK